MLTPKQIDELVILELCLIPEKDWPLDELPEEALAIIREGEAERCPTGVGRHPSKGLFVLQTAGQGPMLCWAEWKKGGGVCSPI